MDIKRKYFDLIIDGINEAYQSQKDRLREVAAMMGECMANKGVVQLFGVRYGDEFVNEMNYRAGGIAPFHALRFRNLFLRELIDQKDVDSGEIYNDTSVIDKFWQISQMDDRDMFCIVSINGNEPLAVELARKAKENGQKVVGVINKVSYDKCGGTLLDYCDTWIDMGADDPDVAVDIDGVKAGQTSSTVANVIAQMLTAEIYKWFIDNGLEAPVLLSANIKGADKHNNSLTDPYERRIR